MPPQPHPIHQPATTYGDPVIRGSSPSSSISSVNLNDQTSAFDDSLTAAEFHSKMEQEIGLNNRVLMREKELLAELGPLLRSPPGYSDPCALFTAGLLDITESTYADTTEAEREQMEKNMYSTVLKNLNKLVSEVQAEQRFERTMEKSLIRPKEQPKEDDVMDIEELMRSMMKPPCSQQQTRSS